MNNFSITILCYYILTTKGTVIERSVIRSAELETTQNLTIYQQEKTIEIQQEHILLLKRDILK